MEKICATCRAFALDLPTDSFGECRYSPPKVDQDNPEVALDYWCGQWHAKDCAAPGKPGKGKRAWSDDLKPTEKHADLAQRLKVNMGEEWGKFKNYCLAHDKRYANFEAAFRNWLVSSVNMNGGKR